MSSEWPITPLSDLITVKHGFAFKGEFFSDEPSPFQLTTPGNFAIGGGFQLGKGKYYNGPVPEDYVLSKGDLIVTMTDLSKAADTLGFSAIIPRTYGTTWLHNQRVGLVVIKPGAPVDKDFLHYLMRTHDYRHFVVSSATGSTVKHTSPGRICAYQFSMPPLNIQRAIAGVLSALDDRITLLRETNATLEAIAQALFKSWFVDFDPVHANIAAKNQPEGAVQGSTSAAQGRMPAAALDAATAALFPDSFEESELGVVPRGWRVSTVQECCIRVESGGTPKRTVPEFWNGTISWLTSGEVRNPIVFSTKEKITVLGVKESSAKIWPPGTTVVAMYGATAGEACMLAEATTANQACCGLVPEKAFRTFLFLSVRRGRESLASKSSGSAQQNLNKGLVANHPTIIPTVDILQKYESVAGALLDRWTENERQAQTLTQLRDTLLPRLISGQLRLPEAEALLEEAL